MRGPGWGIGEAARQFDRLRAEANRIPRGRRVEYELRERVRAWRGKGPETS